MRAKIIGFRLAVWFFAMLGLWWALQAVADSRGVVEFLTDGIVPVVNKKLSPDLMLGLVIVILGLSVVLIFRQEFKRLFGRPKQPASVTPKAAKIAQPKKQRASTQRKTSAVSNWRNLLAAMTLPVAQKTRRVLPHAAQLIRQLGGAAKRIALQISSAAYRHGHRIVILTQQGTISGYKIVKTRLQQLWQWLQPYVEHAVSQITAKLQHHEVFQVLTHVGRQNATSVRNLRKRAKGASKSKQVKPHSR